MLCALGELKDLLLLVLLVIYRKLILARANTTGVSPSISPSIPQLPHRASRALAELNGALARAGVLEEVHRTAAAFPGSRSRRYGWDPHRVLRYFGRFARTTRPNVLRAVFKLRFTSPGLGILPLLRLVLLRLSNGEPPGSRDHLDLPRMIASVVAFNKHEIIPHFVNSLDLLRPGRVELSAQHDLRADPVAYFDRVRDELVGGSLPLLDERVLEQKVEQLKLSCPTTQVEST